MTILPPSLPLSPAAAQHSALLERVAAAAAGVLPASGPLTPGPAQPGSPASIEGYAGAAVADLEGGLPGVLAVVVGSDLVEALAASPLGSLDLAAAAQTAFDAAAEALGGRVGPARSVPLDLVVNDLGGPFTVVPLDAHGGSAALLVRDDTLAAAGGAASPAAPASTPFAAGSASTAPSFARGLEMLQGVVMDVTVELGRTRMSVRELLALTPGTVLELDRAAGSPADLLVNGRLIARGEVVVVDEDFGLRVTEIVDDSAGS